MRVVLVGRLVQINHLQRRPAAAKDRGEVGGDGRITRFLHVAARVRKLKLEIIFPERGGGALLLLADPLHLRVGDVTVFPGPGRTGAVGHDDAGEKFVGPTVAFGDGRVGVDFNIVLVGNHTKVRRTRQRGVGREPGGHFRIGDKNIAVGTGEFHEGN